MKYSKNMNRNLVDWETIYSKILLIWLVQERTAAKLLNILDYQMVPIVA
jgi:hypothetical protein